MSLNVIQNQIGYVNPGVSSLDTGWVINGAYASHSSCNAGTIVALNAFGLVIGRQYVFTYTVSQYISGGVNIIAGTANGASRTANGAYTQTLTMTGNTFLSFYSDGALTIGSLKFYDLLTGVIAGTTISFNEKEEKWGCEYSAKPEMIVKFVDKLFMFQNGGLWQSNVSAVMNNFFGVQYSSQVLFIPNPEYQKNKLWFNMRLDSTGKWYAPSMVIPPNDQFPNGMQSVLTSNNIKSIDGKLWADILRDMTDPNFAYVPDAGLRAASALFRGRMMQGGYMIIMLQCDDITPASLSSAEIYYIDVEKSL